MWVLGYKEGWVPKNWCFQIVVLEKILKSPLDCKKIKPVSPIGNQPWIFTEGLMLKLKLQILCLPDAKCQLIGKDRDAGKDWRQEEKEATEDEMVGWHHWLNGHEFEQNPGDGEGQGGLVSCSPWGHKELTQLSDWTEQQQPYFFLVFLLLVFLLNSVLHSVNTDWTSSCLSSQFSSSFSKYWLNT